MMRGTRAKNNLLAVSANNAETAINTAATLDTAMLVEMGDIINLDTRRESNGDEATGMEEPDTIYDNGATASGTFNFNKAQPQHFAFLLAFALGQVSTVAAGAGYQHTITPIEGDLDLQRSNPSFTAAQQLGNTLVKRRFYSCFVDSVTANFSKDDWLKATGSIKATGKYDTTMTQETVNAAANATSLTLAANGVHGTTAAARLNSVHQVRVELDTGEWTEVVVTAVDGSTPAQLTITAPGGTADLVDYKILYSPIEAAWCTFPSRVVESPLRISNMTLTLGGAWDGSAFVGGKGVTADLSSLEYSLNNGMEVEFVPGSTGAHAGAAFRPQRNQVVKLNRRMQEWIIQNYMGQNETFGLHILAEGAEFDTGHNYTVEFIFPKLGVLSAPLSVDGKRLAEAGDLQVLQDATYGSVIVRVKNLVATYAA